MKAHNDWVTCICAAKLQDSSMFVSGDFSGEVKFFRSNANYRTIRVPNAKITSVVLSPDNSELVVGTMDGRILIYPVSGSDSPR